MGRAACRHFAQKGYEVFALDLKAGEQMEGVIWVSADLTCPQEVEAARQAILARTDKLDVILHMAGRYGLDSLVEMEESAFTGLFDINLFGAYRVNRAFVPFLSPGGRVILVSSELAPLDPLPFTGLYGITKTALEAYAESLRMEMALLGIHVSILRPGAVDTGLLGDSTRAMEQFCARTKLYPCNARNFRTVVESVESRCVSPQRVAALAGRAAEAKRPRYVYNLNRNPLLRLLDLLPRRWQVAAIRMILKPKEK